MGPSYFFFFLKRPIKHLRCARGVHWFSFHSVVPSGLRVLPDPHTDPQKALIWGFKCQRAKITRPPSNKREVLKFRLGCQEWQWPFTNGSGAVPAFWSNNVGNSPSSTSSVLTVPRDQLCWVSLGDDACASARDNCCKGFAFEG